MRWIVTYELARSTKVQTPVQDYPSRGVSLIYNDNELIRLRHEVDTPDSATVDEAIALSEEQLRVFWELLAYKAGRSLAIGRRSAEQMHPAPGTASPRTSDISKPAIVAIASKPVAMPDPQKLEQSISSDDRLVVWLRLANEARNATVDADALRNYYMIWEDKHGAPQLPKSIPTPPTMLAPEMKLKLIRNFVSHGGKLTRQSMLDLVERELGNRVNRYDPTDASQQDLVQRYRRLARQLIEGELNKLL